MRVIAVIVIVFAAAGALAETVHVTRQRTFAREARDFAGGDPERGKDAAAWYGCIACHQVPGYPGTNPHVGPSLKGFANRTFVAGVAENTAPNVIRFIRDPRSVAPKSAMPVLGVSEADARDLATFLYTLR